jgi:hypothetical protein
MTADKHTFPIAMDEAGRLFINHRLCFDPAQGGIIPGEAEKVGARWLRMDADGWLNVGVPAVVARLGDDDGLKGGHLRKVRLFAPTVDGRLAKEDGADFVDCDEWELHVDHFWSGQRYCGTIKGGSRRFKIVIGCQHGHGAETDWDLGNFADQGNERTRDGELTVVTDDGSQVAVRYLSADPIKLGPASQVFDITKLNQGWFYPVFNFLKDLLRLFGIRI